MHIVRFHPEQGVVLPDGKILAYVADIVNKVVLGEEFDICVGSELILTALRAEMKRNDMPHDCINFYVYYPPHHREYGVQVSKSKNYAFIDYEHFPEILDKVLMELVDWN